MDADRIMIKRIYDDPAPADGYRVLVDRLWPRGVSRVRAALDEWAKDIAPSPDLRTWFGHDPARWDEFALRYRAELAVSPALTPFRTAAAARPRTTLLYAARDPQINHARVLCEVLGEEIL